MCIYGKKCTIFAIVFSISVIVIIGTIVGIWMSLKTEPHPNSSWSFKISGNIIGGEFNITLNELFQMPQYKNNYIIRGDTTYTAKFQGVKIAYIFMNIININQSALKVIFIARDGYQMMFDISEILSLEESILAYKMDGAYLKSYEEGGIGYLRLIIPSLNEEDYNGLRCIKNVVEIKFI